MPTPTTVPTDNQNAAYLKGFGDCRDFRSRKDRSFQLNILNHPYEIPGGYEQAYWAGWNDAEEEFRRQWEKSTASHSLQSQVDA